VRLKYVSADRDRHGNVRYYFRRRDLKSKTRIPGLPGSEEFMRAYEALLADKPIQNRPTSKVLNATADSASLIWLTKRWLSRLARISHRAEAHRGL